MDDSKDDNPVNMNFPVGKPVDRSYASAMTLLGFIKRLETRINAMKQKQSPICHLDAEFCVYLVDYLIDYESKSDTTLFPTRLTGVFVRALDDLANPTNAIAQRFIKAYNQIGASVFPEWEPVASIRLTHIDAPDYRLNITFVIKGIIHDTFGEDFCPVDFAVLESEQKVLALHFQRFLNQTWEKGRARYKRCTLPDKNCLSGEFGMARFTVWDTDEWTIFEVSLLADEFYAFRFRTRITSRKGYAAELVDCKVDLILALCMLKEVTENFDLDKFEEDDRAQQFVLPEPAPGK